MNTNALIDQTADTLLENQPPLSIGQQPMNNPQQSVPSNHPTKWILLVGALILLLLIGGGVYVGMKLSHTRHTVSSTIVHQPSTAPIPSPTIIPSAGKQTVSPSAKVSASVPDLTWLVTHLTSSDPAIQEQALVPAVRASSDQPQGVLPPGSKLQIKPETWEVTGISATGEPVAGTIQAILTYPDKPPQEVTLSLAKINDKWLLYQTSQPTGAPN